MRVVFFGSGSFAVPSLAAVLASRHNVSLLVTQPARPAGRGGKLRRTPAAVLAAEHGVDIFECPDVNAADAIAAIKAHQADVICVVDFGQMIWADARNAARLGAFNMHGSLLPALRGAAPVNWAIINGLSRTGVTTFQVVDAMDAGAMYLQRETDIAPHETTVDLKERLAVLGAEAVCETLDRLAAGDIEAIDQDHSLKTLAPKLSKADGLIDFTTDAVSIRNRIHGTWPWPGGQAVVKRAAGKDIPVVIARAEALEGAGQAGVLNDDMRVGTGEGLLRVVEVKPAGKRLMPWVDFLNGSRLAPGDRFAAAGDNHGA